MQTYETFAKIHGLTLSTQLRSKRTDGLMQDSTDHGRKHYHCNLSGPLGGMSFWFSMGSAHTKAPTIGEVLNSLASDAHGSQQKFEDWAADYGYEVDSRAAEKIHKACGVILDGLIATVGLDALDELFYETNEDGE